MNRIVTIEGADLYWPFEDEHPSFATHSEKTYTRRIRVDPFPGYRHDPSLVADIAAQVEESFPIEFLPKYYVLSFDTPHYTNGYADRDNIWDAKISGYSGFEPWIVLMGKRIPPHPAMTRYLVAHEYGHIVQWWIEHKRGIKDETTTDFDRDYMKLRAGCDNEYGGGRWHKNVGELIANDFRICVTGFETEFWPHPGFEHPSKLPAIQEFWEKAVWECAYW
jgi:hypothetical protein